MRDNKTKKGCLVGQERAFTSHLHIFNWSKYKIQDIMSKRVVTAHPTDTLQSVAQSMAENHVSCVVVEDKNKVCGIITQTDLIRFASNNAATRLSEIPMTQASECMKSTIQTVSPECPILHACLLMHNQGIKRLPIVSDDKLVGLVSQTDMIRALESLSALRNVESIMTTDVGTMAADKTALDAIDLMTSRDISSVVVMHRGQPRGVVTHKDIIGIVVAQGKDPKNISIVDIMSFPVVSISPCHSVLSASKIMDEKEIHRLVVCNDNGCCGIVTRTDILNTLHNKTHEEVTKNLHLLTSSTDSIFMLDDEQKTTYVNPSLLALFEADSPTVFLGQAFPPDALWIDPEEKRQFVAKSKNGDLKNSKFKMRTYKGNELMLSLYASVIKEPSGKAIGQQGIVWDFSNARGTASHEEHANPSSPSNLEAQAEPFNPIPLSRHMDQMQKGIDEIRAFLETQTPWYQTNLVHHSSEPIESKKKITDQSEVCDLGELSQLTHQCGDILGKILTSLKQSDACMTVR